MSPEQAKSRKPLAGREWFVRAEDDPNYYFTVYVNWDPTTRSMKPYISNPVYGDPAPGIEEMPKDTLKALRSGRLKGYQ